MSQTMEDLDNISLEETVPSSSVSGEAEVLEEVLDLGDGSKLSLTKRAGWGASPPDRTMDIDLMCPVSFVRLTYTSSKACFSTDECRTLVKFLQDFHKDSGLGDISHNFVVGGDLKLYEGRGFSYAPALPQEYAGLNKTCLEIAFAGNYLHKDPPYHMIMTALDLIKYCIKRRIVDPKFELIPLPEPKIEHRHKIK